MLCSYIHRKGNSFKLFQRHSGSPVFMGLPHAEAKSQALFRACSGRLRSIQGGVPEGATADATGRSRQGGGTLFRPFPGTLGAEIPLHLIPG